MILPSFTLTSWMILVSGIEMVLVTVVRSGIATGGPV